MKTKAPTLRDRLVANAAKTQAEIAGLRHVLSMFELNRSIGADAIRVYREMIAVKVKSRRESWKQIVLIKAKLRALTPARPRA